MALPSKVIVTGAAQGIGRAVALKLATRSAHIAVWDVQTEGVKETAGQRRAQGAIVRACTVDVGDTGQIATAVADFVREWGEPDGLVNNAGIFPRARALDMQLSEWERVLRVNLTGTFVCAQAVAAYMKAAGRGAIVNTASGRALREPRMGRITRQPRAGSSHLPSRWRSTGPATAFASIASFPDLQTRRSLASRWATTNFTRPDRESPLGV